MIRAGEQTLVKNDLVDGLELMIFPITLGPGKRLFADGTIPAAFKVTDSQVSLNGIFIVSYERDGDVRLERRRYKRTIMIKHDFIF